MGIEPRNSKWVIYPQNPGADFLGFMTKDDPSRLPDLAAPNGQNTTTNRGDRISIRNFGYDLFPTSGTLSTTTSPTRSMWTFHLRDGTQILVVAQGASLFYFDETTQAYALLKTGYTSDDFGFAEMNINTDATSWLYFGNAVEDFSRWNGSVTHLTSALVGAEVTIPVGDTTLFTATGSVVIGTTTVTYTGKTPTTLTGAVGTPAAANGLPVSQAVVTFASNPKGNIYLAADNRLFVAGIKSSPQAVFFSKYTDATNYVSAIIVTASTATNSGIFNLVEGGGAVTAMAQDEQSIYIFKNNITYAATLSDSFYSIVPLKPFDGRSQTTGAATKRCVFVGGNRVFFVTKDNQIFSLQRLETIDYPQMVPISYPIQPTIDSFSFNAMSGIVYRDRCFFACKSSPSNTSNDILLVFNIVENTWDTPVTNFAVSEFAIYLSNGIERLLYGDSITSNVWIVTNIPQDFHYSTVASWKTKQYDFDIPSDLKEFDDIFIEGYLAENTALIIRLLLDDNGFTQTLETTLLGTETTFLFGNALPNAFGLYSFGTERFGSNSDISGKKKFRIFLNKNLRRTPFFNAQLEFISDGENQAWEIIRYGFLVRQHSQPQPTALMRNW